MTTDSDPPWPSVRSTATRTPTWRWAHPGDAIVDGIEGSVTVLRGSSTGLTTAGIGGKRFHQDTPGVGGSTEAGDQFGYSVVATFVQGRIQASLVVGARSEDVGGVRGAGQFHQLAISSSGPTGTGSRTLHLDSAGVKGSSLLNANFGLAVELIDDGGAGPEAAQLGPRIHTDRCWGQPAVGIECVISVTKGPG